MLNAEKLNGNTTSEPKSTPRIPIFSLDDLDQGLPTWARRSHPIVRRHLGKNWKTLAFNPEGLLRMFVILSGVVLLGIPFPILFTLLIPIVTVSLVIMPLAMLLYVPTLYNIGATAAASIADERRNQSLDILRVTPYTLTQIILSKGAAAVWRYMEDLSLVLIAVMVCTLPVLTVYFYGIIREVVSTEILLPALLILGLASSIIRIFLEAILIAAVGLCMGAANTSRTIAAAATLGIGIFYFVSINLMRLLPFGMWEELLIEIALPLILPVALTLIFLRLTRRFIEAD